MNDNQQSKPFFSIIIPVWPYDKRPFGLDYVDRLDWPRDRLEVILARGHQPCRQRNEAARIAKGDVLVFFDDDSCPTPDYLQRLAKHFIDPNVAGVGGPNPGVPTDRYIPSLVDAVFTCPFSVFSKRARYRPVAGIHEAGDSDLIFCNEGIKGTFYFILAFLGRPLGLRVYSSPNVLATRLIQCLLPKGRWRLTQVWI